MYVLRGVSCCGGRTAVTLRRRDCEQWWWAWVLLVWVGDELRYNAGVVAGEVGGAGLSIIGGAVSGTILRCVIVMLCPELDKIMKLSEARWLMVVDGRVS